MRAWYFKNVMHDMSSFKHRHPPYRAAHLSIDLSEDPNRDESIEHSLKIAHRVAEASRYELEGGWSVHMYI